MDGHESETDESDVESSMVAWLDLPSSAEPTSSASDPGEVDLCKAVSVAMRFLQTVRLTNIVANAEYLHREIMEASNAINRYLDGIIANDPNAAKELDLLASLIKPSFLAMLFAQRQVFHSLAMKALAPGAIASTIVCWVDGLLAKLAEVTIIVTCGSSLNHAVSDTMRAQLEDDGLRAAAQLPDQWMMVPSVISSPNASPAGKRLAIQLTFAVYVVGPRIQRYNPWDDHNTLHAIDLSKILDQYALAVSIDESSVSYSIQKLVDQIRLSYAMVISLYAASDYELHENRTASPFRPRTLNGLLSMIQLILRPNTVPGDESCITPCKHLDPAQILLLQWGNTLCWCWETWNDCRVADTECIVQLTTTWLYHLQDTSSTPYQDIPNAHVILEKNPSAASYAIIQILQHIATALLAANQATGSFFTVLSNLCRAVVHLLRTELIHGQTLAGAEAIGKYLLSIFVLLQANADAGDPRWLVKSAILESLTLLDHEAFERALVDICEDGKFRFVERVEQLVLQMRRVWTSSTEPGNNFSRNNAEELRLVLYFLIHISYSPEGRKHIQRQPILNLLSSLTNGILRGNLDPLISSSLRDAVILGFCIFETDSTTPIKNPKQEEVWRFALNAGCLNLVATSSFAHHIVATRRFPDPLSCAEAWDHLRDTLILILRGRFMGDERPIALLVSLGICSALVHLLDTDPSTVSFMLTSPWTMSLCAELKTSLQSEASAEDAYCQLLKSQLAPIADVLLNTMRSKIESAETAIMKEKIPNLQSRLVYHGQFPDYSLVLVTVVEDFHQHFTEECT